MLRQGSSATPEPVYEAFDTRKRRRVADLITLEEKLLEEVAALKRSVPAAAAAETAESLRTSLQRDDAMLEERQRRSRRCGGGDGEEAEGAGGDDDYLAGVAPLERQGHVEAEFRTAVEALGRLKREMPAVVAKMERARVAGEYVVTQGR